LGRFRFFAWWPQVNAKARKFSQVVRMKLQEVGQAPIAAACNVDVATVSRWVSEGRLDHFCTALEVMGLKVVPADFKCVKADELEHIVCMAKKYMESLKSASDLYYGDDE